MKRLEIELTKKFVSYVLLDIRDIVPDGTPLMEPSHNSPKGMKGPEAIAISGDISWHGLKILIALP